MSALAQARAKAAPVAAPSFTPVRPGVLQRCGTTPPSQCGCHDESRRLDRHATGQAAPSGAPPIVGDALRSPGRPLDSSMRAYMEPRFGHDFGGVRVHTDARAAASARAVNAAAYTVGRDVVFGGRYAPGTASGRRLLAHELAHVVQQDAASHAVRRAATVSRPGDRSEVEADRAAARVAAGQPAAVTVGTPVPIVQRDDGDDQADPGAGPTDAPGEKALTREEEVGLSKTSPGEVTGTSRPPMISLYNFAIDSAALKERHQAALAELADLLKRSGTEQLRIIAIGHADASGEPPVNNPLSKRRVQAVQRSLQKLVKVGMTVYWFGEDRPVASNDTVEGRSRNRRVDLLIVPPPEIKKDDDKDDDDKKDDDDDKKDDDKKDDDDKKKEDDDETQDDTWFCAQYPILCLIGVGLLFCLIFPEICALPVLPDLDDDDPDKKKEKKQKRRACVASVDLPTGEVEVKHFGILHKAPFKMGVTFTKDDIGCDCSVGEYRQFVKGFFAQDYGKGSAFFKDRPHALAHGQKLERGTFHEDGHPATKPEAYGHRYIVDTARFLPPAAGDPLLGENTDNDQFLPDRKDGCEYKGTDSPGVVSMDMYEQLAFELEFEGGPVDVSDPLAGDVRVGDWHTWWIKYEYNPPPRPKPKPPTPTPTPDPGDGGGGSGGGMLGRVMVPPRPYSGPPGSPYPVFYAGGLPADPVENKSYLITIRFESKGSIYFSQIEVKVVDVTDAEVVFENANVVRLNVAPDKHPPVIIPPRARNRLPLERVRAHATP